MDAGHLLVVASDRVSAFDVVMREPIPRKGAVLTQMSAFWFELLADVFPSHYVTARTREILEQVPRLEGLEEQIAGLLHDISHTAFCHVVDYIYKQEENQEHHESLFSQVFMGSQIPKIAQTNGIRPELFLEMENFFLLERPIPDLCADRLDYFFRDSVLLGVCKRDDIDLFLQHLVVQEGEIMVDDPLIAKMMAVSFMECSRKFWASPTQAASFQILADAIKSGLEAGVIREKDFLLTDQEVYRKLKSSKNLSITSKLDLLNPEFFAVNSPDDFDFFVKTKARYIDPKVVRNGTVKRLSELDETYKRQMQEFIGKVSGGYHVKVFPRLKGLGRAAEETPLFGTLPRAMNKN